MDESNTNPTGANATEDTDAKIYTQTDFDKRVQSETDKVRTSYVKQIKELEAKIPVTKSDTEIALEAKQAEIESKEKMLNFKLALQAKDLDISLADHIKSDADVEQLSTLLDSMLTKRMKQNGYKPENHDPNQGITKAEFDKLSYSEQINIYEKDPDIFTRFKK